MEQGVTNNMRSAPVGVSAGSCGGPGQGTLPRPGAQGVPMVLVIKREGMAFKAEWQHLKKPGIKRDRGSLGNWQWFSSHTESVEQRVLGSLLQT